MSEQELKIVWERFISHLNVVQPLGKNEKSKKDAEKKEEKIRHKNLIGSIESYRKIFIGANVTSAEPV